MEGGSVRVVGSEAIPWPGFRHLDTVCNHIHVATLAMTLTDRDGLLRDLKQACEDTHTICANSST